MVDASIAQIAAYLGIGTVTATTLFYVISVWEAIWTGLAMWKTAKRNHLWWFIIFFVVNLFGIPEIIYLIVTRKKESAMPAKAENKKRK